MGGVLGSGRAGKMTALGSLQAAADIEEQRESANEAFKSRDRQQKISMTTSGAMAGAYIGAQVSGPWAPVGALAGAGIGYLLTEIF